MLPEHSKVMLTVDLPEQHLKSGDVGVIVHVYQHAPAYEVEFFTIDGQTFDVVTVSAHQVQMIMSKAILHARSLD